MSVDVIGQFARKIDASSLARVQVARVWRPSADAEHAVEATKQDRCEAPRF